MWAKILGKFWKLFLRATHSNSGCKSNLFILSRKIVATDNHLIHPKLNKFLLFICDSKKIGWKNLPNFYTTRQKLATINGLFTKSLTSL